MPARLLLLRRGLRVLVADASPAPFPLPRAVAVDDDVLRVLRTIVDVGGRVPLNSHQRAGFLDAAGHLLLEVSFGEGDLGLPELAFVHQPTLEAELRAGLPDLRLGAPVEVLGQDAGGVSALVGGSPVRAAWVVACDGAGSPTRSGSGSRGGGETTSAPG